MEKKEVWSFDLNDIKKSDFDLIYQEAKKLPDPESRIAFYRRAYDEVEQASGKKTGEGGHWSRSEGAIYVLSECMFAMRSERRIIDRAEKEVWPGAGIYFDWEDQQGDDRDRVEEHLRQMPDEKARLDWLDRFFIEYDYVFPLISKWSNPSRDVSLGPLNELHDQCIRLQTRAKSIAAMEEAALTDEPEAIGEQSDSIKLSIAQSVWAVHFLLTHAGMRQTDVNKTDVAKFISALTGWNYGGVYQRMKDKRQGTSERTLADLAAIRPFFEKLGLLEIVAKIDRGED